MSTASFVANEDIGVSLFVSLVAGADHRIEVAGAGVLAIGVSQNGPQDPVLPGGTVGPAALEDHACRIHTIGEDCEVLAGDVVAAGDFLKPDGDGKAVPCSSGDEYSAIARAGASAADQLVQITIEHGVAP